MNDERILKHLSIIKRNNLFIVLGLAMASLIVKMLLGLHFTQYITEVFFITSIAIIFGIAIVYRSKEPIEDERVRYYILKIYNIGFSLITMLGILTYYVSIMFIDTFYGLQLFTNTFINTSIFLCLIFSYINIRKNKMSFNHRIIEQSNLIYYKGVGLRILYLFIYFIGIALITNIVKLLFELSINMIFIDIAILVSFLSFSIEYFLFSIYEKIRYNENVKMDEGSYRYLSKNVLYLFILITIFNIAYASLNYWNTWVFRNDFLGTDIWITISMLSTYFSLIKINFIILTLIMNLIIIKSICRIDLIFPKFFKVFKVMVWVNFGVSVVFWLYSLSYRVLSLIMEEYIQLFAKINSITSITISIVSIIVTVLIFIFLNLNEIKYRYLIIVRVIVSTLISYVIPQFIYKHYNMNLVSSVSSSVRLAGIIIQTILTLILIISLSNSIEKKPINEIEQFV